MTIDLDDLEAKARAATNGYWFIYDVDLGVSYIDSDAVPATQPPLAKIYAANDAAYIVAAQPSVVLGLIARVRELEEALQKIAGFNDKFAERKLAETGSYSHFDEPVSVKIARTALGGNNG